MNSKIGNLAKLALPFWKSEAMPKQPMFKDMGDASSFKKGDVQQSQKPIFEFISV
jgi:hypothetical protein